MKSLRGVLMVVVFLGAAVHASAQVVYTKNEGGEMPEGRKDRSSWGLQIQFMSNSMKSQETDLLASAVETVQMQGSSVGLYGYYNHPMNSFLILHGGVGYEPFVASGTSDLVACDQFTSTDCTANINYLSVRGALRSFYEEDRYRAWGELGVSLKHALSASSTALQEDKINQVSTLDIGVGFDYLVNSGSYIPVSLQYSLFPSNENVQASSVTLRIGYGWNL